MRNTLYDNTWKEGRVEGADKKELEIKNEINNRIENGMSPEESLKELGLLE